MEVILGPYWDLAPIGPPLREDALTPPLSNTLAHAHWLPQPWLLLAHGMYHST